MESSGTASNVAILVEYSSSSDEEQPANVASTAPNQSSHDPTNKTDTSMTSKRVQLRVEECPDALKGEIKRPRTFYERLLNPLHPGAALAPATLDKLKERALCFFTTARMLKIYII